MKDFITWAGGECPVADGTYVDIKLRGGKIFEKQMAWGSENQGDRPEEAFAFNNNASAAYWLHTGGAFDIVGYRLHESDTKPTSAPLDFTQGGDAVNDDAKHPASAKLRCKKCGSEMEFKFDYAGITLSSGTAEFIGADGIQGNADKSKNIVTSDVEFDALRVDAERYRCLRKQKISSLLLEPDDTGAFNLKRLKKLDKAVDAIREAK